MDRVRELGVIAVKAVVVGALVFGAALAVVGLAAMLGAM